MFFDDYIISKSLLNPVSTLFSCFAILVLIIGSLLLKNKYSILSFSILWFFAGHTLESSFIPLEIYFEHRNYLPSFGIIFGLCFLTLNYIKSVSTLHIKYSLIFLIICYCILITIISFNEAKLWVTPKQQSLIWQSNHPLSQRANVYAAQTWIELNHPLKADKILKDLILLDPSDSAPHLMRLELNCLIQHLSPLETDNIFQLLPHTKSDFATAESALKLTKRWMKNQCPNISILEMENILSSTLNNAKKHKVKTSLASTLSLFYAASNQYNKSFMVLNKTLASIPGTKSLILLKIRWAIANKHYKDALEWIKQNKQTYTGLKLSNINFINQLDEMENDIHQLQK